MKTFPRIRAAGATTMALLVAACSPMATRIDAPETDAGPPHSDGLVYWLPLKGIRVTLTVASDAKRTVSVDATPAYPDTRRRFVAQFRRSQVNENNLGVGVDENGLLQGKANSTVTPKVSQVIAGLGGALGSVMTAAMRSDNVAVTPSNQCASAGTYTWVVIPQRGGRMDSSAQADMKLCSLAVSLKALFDPKGEPDTLVSTGQSWTGFFYRQAWPYEVSVIDEVASPPAVGVPEDQLPAQTFLVAIPTADSPVEFLPVHRSLFATNTMTVTFASGSPTIYSQDLDSEWLGVVTLPAAVVSSYFGAVGAVFSKKQAADVQATAYLTGLNSLAAQQLKTDACIAALKSRDDGRIKAACP